MVCHLALWLAADACCLVCQGQASRVTHAQVCMLQLLSTIIPCLGLTHLNFSLSQGTAAMPLQAAHVAEANHPAGSARHGCMNACVRLGIDNNAHLHFPIQSVSGYVPPN